MSELKPCPFCGEKAKITATIMGDQYRPECTNVNCGCRWWTRYNTKKEAIEAWNNRWQEVEE